jgi:hypothetical protein
MTIPEADTCLSRSMLGMSYDDLLRDNRRLKQANRKLTKVVRRLIAENGDDFALHNSPATKRPWRGIATERTRQAVLLSGMDCLAGQQDLFKADGEAASTYADTWPDEVQD